MQWIAPFLGIDAPGSRPSAVLAARKRSRRGLGTWDDLEVALVTGVAIAAAITAGLSDPAQLGVLAVSSSCVAAGVSPRRRSHAGATAGLLTPVAAVPVLGLGPPACLLLGALISILYTRHLAARTPYAIVAAGAAVSCFALAGWATVAGIVRPTPLLIAAVVFLWVPGHAWSRSLMAGSSAGVRGAPILVAVAGIRQTAAAISAASFGLVAASLALTPRLPWPYAAVVVPAGACLLAVNVELRRRPDNQSAARASAASATYLGALLAGLLASTL